MFVCLGVKLVPSCTTQRRGHPYMDRVNAVNEGDTKLEVDLEIKYFNSFLLSV